MYRVSLEMENDKDQCVFLKRVAGYPVVNMVMVYSTDAYAKAKDYNGLIRFTLNTAEKTVLIAADHAKPVIAKFELPISIVNTLACKTLDKIEEKLPLVKKTPEELAEETKKIYNTTVVEPVVTRYNDVKSYSLQKANAVMDYSYKTVVVLADTKYGQFVTLTLDHILLKADYLVDNYIPVPKIEGLPEEPKMKDDGNPVDKALVLSKKFSQRVSYHALIQLKAAKKRTEEILSNLNVTVDLIEYAKAGVHSLTLVAKNKLTNAKQQIQKLWEEFNKQAEEAGAKTVQQKLLYVAGQLTNQLKATYQKLASAIAVLPAKIQPSIKVVQDYINNLHSQISKANTWRDVYDVVLTQWKDAIAALQKISSQYFDAVLNSKYVSLLVKALNDKMVTENGMLASGNSPKADEKVSNESQTTPTENQVDKTSNTEH